MATASSPRPPPSASSPTDSTGPHRDTNTSAQALYFLNLRILLLLIAFRLLNALCLSTFFQPDEFFPSLEPAWQIVWGPDSGAWITWVSSPDQDYLTSLALTSTWQHCNAHPSPPLWCA